MLKHLQIRNFALVDFAELEFGPGVNLLTGETGAGKSLILGALSFLLGDKLDAGTVRADAGSVCAQALFQLPPGHPCLERLAEWGVAALNGEVLLRREYSIDSGRTRSWLNGDLVTAAMTAELGASLVEVHGQHEQQAVFQPSRHRELVDRFSAAEGLRRAVREAFERLRALREERDALGGDPEEAARRRELLAFQEREITEAGLENLDEEALRQEFQVLRQADRIGERLARAGGALDGGDAPGAEENLGEAAGELTAAAKLDPSLEGLAKRLRDLQAELREIAFETARRREACVPDPERLEEVTRILDRLGSLKKKYGGSREEVLAHLTRIREELARLADREGRLAALEGEIGEAERDYAARARELSKTRKNGGAALARKVREVLARLGLPKAVLEVQVEPRESAEGVEEGGRRLVLSPEGWDRVEFLLSANPGEPPRPLARVASGGEASRVLLALKSVLAAADAVPTLVFDEIDTGIGARAAPVVAEVLGDLGRAKQVLCVTHLAPLAALGETHYVVSKCGEEGKTRIAVKRLTEPERLEEIARMLGGEPVTETSRVHARELYARIRSGSSGKGRPATLNTTGGTNS